MKAWQSGISGLYQNAREHPVHSLLLVGILLLLVETLTRVAWVCDDAFISFRTVDNFVHGDGLVYNVGERVQAFSNPLWTLLMVPIYAITGEAFHSSILLGLCCTLGAVLVGLRLRTVDRWMALGLIALLLCSKAFMDFATSGLENSLSYLLIALFLYVYNQNSPRRLFHLALLTGLLMLNRLDLGALVLPALLYAWYQSEEKGKWKTVLLGLSPLLLWEVFAIVYYGFPFPNTWYAKLGTAYPVTERWGQGWAYFLDSLRQDPLTLTLILGGGAFLCWRAPRWRPVLLGMGLYLLLMFRSGGDFMSGRFFAVPFLLVAGMLVSRKVPRKAGWVALGLLLALGLSNANAPLWSGARYEVGRTEDPAALYAWGITDERAMAWKVGGWRIGDRRARAADAATRLAKVRKAQEAAGPAARQVKRMVAVGYAGYVAGPGIHIVDELALTDPLLAHMPALNVNWRRPGHYPRAIPEGYLATLQSGHNAIADSVQAIYYDAIAQITRGPLFGRARWAAIWRLNLGLLPIHSDPEQVRQPVLTLQMAKNDSAIQLPKRLVPRWWSWKLRLDEAVRTERIALRLSGQNVYRLEFWRNGFPYAWIRLPRRSPHLGEKPIPVPEELRSRGFDALMLRRIEGGAQFTVHSLDLFPTN